MTTTPLARTGASGWEQLFQDSLQIIAEGLTELVGFGMAVINVRRGDELVVVALAGTETARRPDGTRDTVEEMLGSRWPITRLDELLAVADDWGAFKFVPHDRAPDDGWMWVRDLAEIEDGSAWHPNDGAIAPVHDASGELVAVISVDAPRTGRHPDTAQRRVMDKYAAETAKVVLAALEREALERRLRFAEGARQLVRTASRHLALDTLLEETGPSFLEAFAASGLWLRVPGAAESLLAGSRHALPVMPSDVAVDVSAAAEQLWERRQAAVVYADGREVGAVLDRGQTDAVRRLLTAGGIGSVLHAPLGAGRECLGSLILVRDAGHPDWSDAERAQAAEIGRDLGRIIRTGRTYARTQELVRELRALDAHKDHVITMISHELKNPLTVLLANRDLLEPEVAGDEAVLERLAAVDANAQRMSGVVDDLLLLARLADADTVRVERDVDLRVLLDDVRTALATSGRPGPSIELGVPDEPLVVRGDAAELRTMLATVVRNVLAPRDEDAESAHLHADSRWSAVTVTATASAEEVAVAVTDGGVGMSPDDHARLLEELLRSGKPAVPARGPGGGLGLAIVERILRRHGGRAEVTATPGEGTTVRVHLPRAGSTAADASD